MAPIYALLLYGCLFVGVLLLVDAGTRFVRVARGLDDETVDRRLAQPSATVAARGPEGSVLRRPTVSTTSWLRFIPFLPRLLRLFDTSGIRMSLEGVVGIMGIISLLIFVALMLFLPMRFFAVSILFSLVIGIGTVLLYIMRARKRRLDKFGELLPDAIDLITRSLKIGHPFSGAMDVVSKELPEPISSEFATAFEQVTYGQDIATALTMMAERVPVQDLGYVAMAVQIQQEAGGNLVESLTQLSTVIRERFRMFRKVKALTAEGRFSAWFLSLFPFFLVPIVILIKPDYYTQVMDLSFFWDLVAVALGLLIVNVIAMRVITTLKV